MPRRKRSAQSDEGAKEGVTLRRSQRKKVPATSPPHQVKGKRRADKKDTGKAPPQKRVRWEDKAAKAIEGTIERGHIYFFYRPKVDVEEVYSIDDVRNFHILLVPRPPQFSVSARGEQGAQDGTKHEERSDMEILKVLSPGADAVPAPAPKSPGGAVEEKQKWRLITVGKKQLPVPRHVPGDDEGTSGEREKGTEAEQGAVERTKGSRRSGVFWASITGVGDDLTELEGLGESTYETKTRGTRHQSAARLLARGAYAIVNRQPGPPSSQVSHLGYYISHPQPDNFGEVQQELGIVEPAGSFVLQVKNPLAPSTGIPIHTKPAEYPKPLMMEIFGTDSTMLKDESKSEPSNEGLAKDAEEGDKGQAEIKGNTKGRERYGLRFATCESSELLGYKGAQLLLIASRGGIKGVDIDLGEGVGEALQEAEEKEGEEYNIQDVLDELGLEVGQVFVQPLEGKWI